MHEMAKLELVLKGIKRLQAVEKGTPKQKLSITQGLLLRIKQVWEKVVTLVLKVDIIGVCISYLHKFCVQFSLPLA